MRALRNRIMVGYPTSEQSRLRQEGVNPMTVWSSRSLWTLAIGVGAISACSHQAATPPEPKAAQTETKKSNSVVNSSDIDRAAGAPIEKILADRVAGGRLGRDAEGNLTVRIRAASSFSANPPALLVV